MEDEVKTECSARLIHPLLCNLNEPEIYVLMLIRRGDELKITYSCSYMHRAKSFRLLLALLIQIRREISKIFY